MRTMTRPTKRHGLRFRALALVATATAGLLLAVQTGLAAADEGSDGGDRGAGAAAARNGENGAGGQEQGGGGAAKQQSHDGATHPAGNNGTVKIDGEPFDDHPNNEPHPGCTFQIDLYNYDEGDLDATYTFDLHAPTGSGELLTGSTFIGEDPNGGGTDLDASETIDLSEALEESGAEPHAQQGFHVKLTIHAEGSIGSDVKHKVFWVECAGAEVGGEVETPPAGPEGEGPEVGGEVTGPGEGPEGEAGPEGGAVVGGVREEREARGKGAEVLGVQAERALAVTGMAMMALAVAGASMIATGTLMTRVRRRR